MENEQERGLVLYIEQSLAKLDQGPKPKIQAVVRLNSEVYGQFKIGEFLNMLNEKLFGGKGEVKPLNHSYSISPSVQEDEQSRFARLFSARIDLNSVSSGAALRVKKDDLKMGKDEKSFDDLVIRISQSVDIKEENYTFYTSGSLVWKPPEKNYVGSFGDSKPVHLVYVYEGRLLSFSFRFVPSAEEISKALFENAEEVLRELALHDLIPDLKKEEDSPSDPSA